MTDYWVSTKKHYCEVCKCWITGSALNVKNHESSARHISSLRTKIIESHRKQIAKKEQDAFEAAEIARLNTVTLDGPSIGESSGDTGLCSSPFYMHNRVLNPPVDKEKEQSRVLAALSRALAGAPMEDSEPNRNTTWMAFIDQDDGTLTYYNNVTGLKTKNRPRDFDGVLPTSSSSLTSNWTLKYDPSKGAKYYHNATTGEIRWLEQPRAQDTTRPSESSTVGSGGHVGVLIKVEQPTTKPAVPKAESQIRIKLEHAESAESASSKPAPPASVAVKREPEEGPQGEEAYAPTHRPSVNEADGPKVQYAAPEIGEWEVVQPEASAFSHSIVSMDPYLNPPVSPVREPDIFDVIREATYETPLLNVDDLQVQEKQVFTKPPKVDRDSEVTIQFAKRKVPKKK
ncbi:U1 small nuclear ribonucleoprotein C, putative [Babesia caballi]|uniref:U1 small nuclear ribonucleoprotein C, putative n=1 Tax=Babesia caballi TaxID=5871 RepID=A0AAV4LL59_BABCB|nr:U1 small nuclear ribonucleoprotein C, putative [Babesia caballi]